MYKEKMLYAFGVTDIMSLDKTSTKYFAEVDRYFKEIRTGKEKFQKLKLPNTTFTLDDAFKVIVKERVCQIIMQGMDVPLPLNIIANNAFYYTLGGGERCWGTERFSVALRDRIFLEEHSPEVKDAAGLWRHEQIARAGAFVLNEYARTAREARGDIKFSMTTRDWTKISEELAGIEAEIQPDAFALAAKGINRIDIDLWTACRDWKEPIMEDGFSSCAAYYLMPVPFTADFGDLALTVNPEIFMPEQWDGLLPERDTLKRAECLAIGFSFLVAELDRVLAMHIDYAALEDDAEEDMVNDYCRDRSRERSLTELLSEQREFARFRNTARNTYPN
jgi:hypothetical protein